MSIALKGAAARFVRSAVLVDDRAYAPRAPDSIKHKVEKPPRLRAKRAAKESEPSTPPEPVATADPAHDLDADAIAHSFARAGILCSILAPRSTDPGEVAADVFPVAAHADVVILDWVLDPGGSGEGEETSEIVARLVCHALQSEMSPQLRALLIYTGSPNLREIPGILKEKIEGLDLPLPCVEEEFALRIGSVRVGVYAKPDNEFDPGSPETDRVVAWDDLVEQALYEFAKLSPGIVRATALQAVAAIRDNTFRIIERFRNELDAPYLAHRSLLGEPEDAVPFLLDLIGAEVAETIEGSQAGDAVSEGALKEWLDVEMARRDLGRLFQPGHDPSPHEVMTLLRRGHKRAKSEIDRYALSDRGIKAGRLTQAFSGLPDPPNEKVLSALCLDLDREFAALVATRANAERRRFLRAGYVLSLEDAPTEFFLCLQPFCDSVRLEDATRFPTAPLEEVDQRVDFAMLIAGTFRTFKVVYEPRRMSHLEFVPQAESDRVGVHTPPCTIHTREGRQVMLHGELRFSHTQRILNRYGETLARVGLNEYEWLRLK